jgi:hypothetical protein
MIDLYNTMYSTTVRQIDYIHRELQYYDNIQTDNMNRLYINGRSYIIEQIDPVTQLPIRRQPTATPYTSAFRNPTGTNPFARQPQTTATSQNANTGLNVLLAEVIRQFDQPVVVRPTTLEISNATREVIFENVMNPPNNSCPICLDQFQGDTVVTQIRHCGHLFVPREINRWFQSNVRCPVCRYDIRSQSSPLDTSGNTNTHAMRRNDRERRTPLQSTTTNPTNSLNITETIFNMTSPTSVQHQE